MGAESVVRDVTGAISNFAETQARDYVTSVAKRQNWSLDITLHGFSTAISPEDIGLAAGKVVGGVVDSILDRGVDAFANRGIAISNIVGRQKVGPHTVGEYRDVAGHHPHQQASRGDNKEYDPRRAVAVADDGSFNHSAIFAEQRRLNAGHARSGKPYTLDVEEQIQRQAMLKGGMKPANIERILEISREELKRQGALDPTRVPGSRRGK